MFEAGFLPIVGAGIVAILIGWVWYSPSVFGRAWMRMSNITPEMAERGKKRMPLTALVGLLAAMLIAWVMNSVGIALGVADFSGAFVLGLWCWLGFTAPTMLGMVLWEQKPLRLYFINVLYWLVAFIAMSFVLLFFGHGSLV